MPAACTAAAACVHRCLCGEGRGPLGGRGGEAGRVGGTAASRQVFRVRWLLPALLSSVSVLTRPALASSLHPGPAVTTHSCRQLPVAAEHAGVGWPAGSRSGCLPENPWLRAVPVAPPLCCAVLRRAACRCPAACLALRSTIPSPPSSTATTRSGSGRSSSPRPCRGSDLIWSRPRRQAAAPV